MDTMSEKVLLRINADTFISYLEDARKVRCEVMDMLLLVNEKHIIVIEWMT